MNRLLIESIEGRILAGISMFVGIMILVGWVAINEEARMQSFVQQHTGRAIERGAELFASNCSTCHAADGRGIGGFAPALNNPHLFGYDPLASYNSAIVGANRALTSLEDASEALTMELTDGENPPSAERQDEIIAELEEINVQIDEQEEIIAQTEIDRLAALEGLSSANGVGLYPLWDREAPEDLTDFLLTNGTRLAQVGWTGDLHGYISTTLIHGRPGSGNFWGSEGMAAWSQRAGGPLRDDQIEDLTAYILNWDKGSNWTTEDLFSVNQFGKPLADGSIPTEDIPTVGTNVDEILARWAENEIVGDAANGEALYAGRYGCGACHAGGIQAPAAEGTFSRAENERITEPEFADYTAEEYVIESIVLPNAYDYPNDDYAGGLMPATFADSMQDQELADIVEYLRSQG